MAQRPYEELAHIKVIMWMQLRTKRVNEHGEKPSRAKSQSRSQILIAWWWACESLNLVKKIQGILGRARHKVMMSNVWRTMI